jgi:hypothetical protein
MQVSQSDKLEDGRGFHSIGRIKASSEWRSVDAPIAEADRLTALRALIRETEEYDADAIIDLVLRSTASSAPTLTAFPCSESSPSVSRSNSRKWPDRRRSPWPVMATLSRPFQAEEGTDDPKARPPRLG